ASASVDPALRGIDREPPPLAAPVDAPVPSAPFADSSTTPAAAPVARDLVVEVVDRRTGAPLAGVGAEIAFFDGMPERRGEFASPADVAKANDVPCVAAVSDGAGRLVAAGFRSRAFVRARRGALFGEAWFSVDRPSDRTLALRPGVEVVAVRADGTPAADLVLQATSDPKRRPWWNSARTDAEGRAFVTPVPTREHEPRWMLRPLIVGLDADPATIDADAPPADPVRLTLPATAALALRAKRADGATETGATFSRWSRLRGLSTAPSLHPDAAERGVAVLATPMRDGVLRLPYTAPGAVFRVEVEVTAPGRRGGVGFAQAPAAGAEATAEILCGARALVAAGRVVDENGEALKDCEVSAEILEPGEARAPALAPWSEASRLAGADGAFRVTFDRDLEPPHPAKIRVKATPRGPQRSLAAPWLPTDLDAPAPRDGVIELGDVVIRPTPWLCEGVVVDPTGAPVAGAHVQAHRFHDGRWTVRPASTKSDETGRFRLGDAPGDDATHLVARTETAFTFEPAPVERGRVDLRLVVAPAGGLEGSFRLGDRTEERSNALFADASPIEVRVIGAAADHPIVRSFFSRADKDGRPWADVPVRGERFVARDLRPGTARVELRLRATGRVLFAADDVVIPPGATCRDPRLQEIDLTELGRRRAILVVDEAGAPLADAFVALHGADEGVRTARTDHAGRAFLPYGAEVPRGFAVASGRFPAALDQVAADATAVLRKASRRH
ncbi:MAG TPA: carboxypeptidase-like regulatory domain-containing protein, partial [Planctomycetota bacterium]|nr:carboxypeptidase-like regulatory domain-containing protein [Planctomycetota bacterium]